MDAKEMLPGGSLVNDGISDPLAATTGAFPTGDHSGSWKSFDTVFENPVKDLNALQAPKDIDPQGLFEALPAPQYLQVPRAPQQEVIPPPDMIYLATHARGAIAKQYEAIFRRLDLDLASREAREEGTDHVNTLQQNFSAPGVEMNIATPGPFIVSTPGNTGAARPAAPIKILIPKLLVTALEPVRRQQEHAAAEKVLDDVEAIAVNLEHNSTESFNEGPSSSNGSQQ